MYHYQPLKDFLAARGDRTVSLSYEEIEAIIDRPLPPSAKGELNRQWWANAPSHSQARAWLSVGRKAKLHRADRSVTFSRPASATTVPAAIMVDRSDLHPIALRLIETIVADCGMDYGSAAAALLNSAAADRDHRSPTPAQFPASPADRAR